MFDVATATALAQILPIILLALMVELRRVKIHRRGRSIRRTRAIMAVFFTLFASIETVLVLSIDGRLFPTQWSDIVAALIIFAMLWLLFVLSFMSEKEESERELRQDGRRAGKRSGGREQDAGDDAL
ncbi:hypothetical protein [Subtercola boreus]|uniref:hypothetical protein n=1 Tax=Subtercola boreus TaxID=120213 RepID=UPI001C0F1E6C|nr:hypothetical protein [Subtercola boreus]